MILLKCAVVHHANLNSSSTNNLYLRTVEYVIFFFFFFLEIIYCIYFNEAFIKNSMKILSFLIKISKINFKM